MRRQGPFAVGKVLGTLRPLREIIFDWQAVPERSAIVHSQRNGTPGISGVEFDVTLDFHSYYCRLADLAINFAAAMETVEHARMAGEPGLAAGN